MPFLQLRLGSVSVNEFSGDAFQGPPNLALPVPARCEWQQLRSMELTFVNLTDVLAMAR
jgi:hypothetical protein